MCFNTEMADCSSEEFVYKLNEILPTRSTQTEEVVTNPMSKYFPINSVEDLEEIEHKLQNDEQIYAKVVKYFFLFLSLENLLKTTHLLRLNTYQHFGHRRH